MVTVKSFWSLILFVLTQICRSEYNTTEDLPDTMETPTQMWQGQTIKIADIHNFHPESNVIKLSKPLPSCLCWWNPDLQATEFAPVAVAFTYAIINETTNRILHESPLSDLVYRPYSYKDSTQSYHEPWMNVKTSNNSLINAHIAYMMNLNKKTEWKRVGIKINSNSNSIGLETIVDHNVNGEGHTISFLVTNYNFDQNDNVGNEITYSPTISPTNIPSIAPSISPTNFPTYQPTINPTNSPITTTTIPTMSPITAQPTMSPITAQPTPTTEIPTKYPTYNPTITPTYRPTTKPVFTMRVDNTVHNTLSTIISDNLDANIAVDPNFLTKGILIGVSITATVVSACIIWGICMLCKRERKSIRQAKKRGTSSASIYGTDDPQHGIHGNGHQMNVDFDVTNINITNSHNIKIDEQEQYLSDTQKEKLYKTAGGPSYNNKMEINPDESATTSIIFDEYLSDAQKEQMSGNMKVTQKGLTEYEGKKAPERRNLNRQPTTDDVNEMIHFKEESDNEVVSNIDTPKGNSNIGNDNIENIDGFVEIVYDEGHNGFRAEYRE